MAITASALIAAWTFSHGENRATIREYRERSNKLYEPEYQKVLNSEYWFGSQPVQFLFDDKHFMIVGANQQYFGYIPLSRIHKIEIWKDAEDFVGEHHTPALWLTIEGQVEYWADSHILIPGHFFEEDNLDEIDSRHRFDRFYQLLNQSCPNLRQS